jgi:hypothetical protein
VTRARRSGRRRSESAGKLKKRRPVGKRKRNEDSAKSNDRRTKRSELGGESVRNNGVQSNAP